MKQYLKIFVILCFNFAAVSYADTPPVPLYNFQPSRFISPHQQGKIMLDQIDEGAVYIVYCEIGSGAYLTNPVKVTLDSPLRSSPIFFINGIQGNQGTLDRPNNEYEAKAVIKSTAYDFLSIINNDDSAQIVFTGNCTATLETD